MPGRIGTYRSIPQRSAVRAYERGESRQADKNFYSSAAWLKFRAEVLDERPLCEDCEAKGLTTAAVHVHHVRPRKKRPDLAFEKSNAKALCPPCHNAQDVR